MIVEQLSLRNWLRFRGDHSLRLEAKTYAVVAEWDGLPDESNWAGKSSLLEAVRFALFGDHRAKTEDGWITRGEKEGHVEVRLTGLIARRSRARGKSTQLVVWLADKGGELKGDEAQLAIDRAVGLSRDDFDASAYFEQKKLARLATCDPTTLADILTAWFRLEKLEAGADQAARDEKAAGERARDAAATVRTIEAAARLDGCPEGESVWEHAAKVYGEGEVEHAALVREQRALEARRVEQQAVAAAADAIRARNAERAKIIQRGLDLRAEIERLGFAKRGPLAERADVAGKALFEAKVSLEVATSEQKEKQDLCTRGFDGTCPVMGTECPARGDVEDAVRGNAGLVQEASEKFAAARFVYLRARAESAEAEAAMVSAEKKNRELVELRKRLAEMGPEEDVAPTASDDLEEQLAKVRTTANAVLFRMGAARRVLDLRARYDQALGDREAEERTVAMARAARACFQGARRDVSAARMAEITEGANGMLADIGARLTVDATFERPTKKLADACEECGAAFPASAKAKACEECGAKRGQQMERKPRVEVSDESGAALDLAGAAFQLSAAAWLRRDRAAAWSTALIDEPFGALDRAKTKTLAAHLMGMLSRRYGFEQAMVIAHTASVLDALPGRILVRAGPEGSTVEVVS